MTIKIKRITEYYYIFTPVKIKLNGEDVGTVDFEQTKEINIPSEPAELSVRQPLTTSNKINVSNGDEVAIRMRLRNLLLYPVLLFCMMMLPSLLSIEGFINRSLVMLPFIPLMFLTGIRILRLEIINKDHHYTQGKD